MNDASRLSERTNEVGQERHYQTGFVHYRGAERHWRLPTHRRWVHIGYRNHLSDKLLVHASIQTTQDIYTHVFDDAKREAADAMDRLFGEVPKAV